MVMPTSGKKSYQKQNSLHLRVIAQLNTRTKRQSETRQKTTTSVVHSATVAVDIIPKSDMEKRPSVPFGSF